MIHLLFKETTSKRRENVLISEPVYVDAKPEWELPYEFLRGDGMLPDDLNRILRSIAYLKDENDKLKVKIEALMGDEK